MLVPSDFSQRLQALAQTAAQPGSSTSRPVITVSPNPRAGTLGSSIASQTQTQALVVANQRVGQQVTAEFARTAAGAPLPGAVGLVLANPIDVQITPHDPLPNGTGSGLSAFYYSLLVYLGVATWLGMPIPREWPLFGYGVFAIVAVGVTATSMIAALGSMGLLVNLLVFVILGLPSAAGATVPLEATPTFFLWLAHFEPMHQVYLGTRALLYFNGHADAGLSRALTMCGIGLAVGLTLGVVVTRIYDREGYHRIAAAPAAAMGKAKAAEVNSTGTES